MVLDAEPQDRVYRVYIFTCLVKSFRKKLYPVPPEYHPPFDVSGNESRHALYWVVASSCVRIHMGASRASPITAVPITRYMRTAAVVFFFPRLNVRRTRVSNRHFALRVVFHNAAASCFDSLDFHPVSGFVYLRPIFIQFALKFQKTRAAARLDFLYLLFFYRVYTALLLCGKTDIMF